jgi:hypothetical protein
LLSLDRRQRVEEAVRLRRDERELGVAVQLAGMKLWNEGVKSDDKNHRVVKGAIGLEVCLADVSVTETCRRVSYGHNGRSAVICTQKHANYLAQSLKN